MAIIRRPNRALQLGGLAILLLAGCAVIPEYPSQLPPLVEADERLEHCPPIAGRYRDEGTAVSLEGKVLGHISLTRLVHGRNTAQPPAEVVEIVGPQDDLVQIQSRRSGAQVATWRQHKITKEMYLEKGESSLGESYLCEKGFVRLGRTYQVAVDGIYPVPAIAISSDFLWVRRAIDGSLIALHRAGAGALVAFVLPVPTEKGYTLWYRFPPAQGSGEGLPGQRGEDASH